MLMVQQQNQRFFIKDKTTGIDLFKSDLRCVTLHYNMAHLQYFTVPLPFLQEWDWNPVK